jgi:hypothetical protein
MLPDVRGSSVRAVSPAVKLAIGAGAGFCLSLVKLLEVNFYIGQAGPVILGGVLTMVAFGVVAALFTAFGNDEHDTAKLFMQGLLAPSLIIALVHRGADLPTTKGPDVSIPTLGALSDLLIPTLYAEPQAPAPPHPAAAVTVLKPDQFDGSVTDGALMLLGRSQDPSSFAFVVGKTTDPNQAQATAAKVRAAAQHAGLQETVHVVKAATSGDYFVTVGGFHSAADTATLKKQVVAKVLVSPLADQATLRLLVQGPVIDGRALLAPSK